MFFSTLTLLHFHICACKYTHIQGYFVLVLLKWNHTRNIFFASCFCDQTIPHGNSSESARMAWLNGDVLRHGLTTMHLALPCQRVLPLFPALGYCTLVCTFSMTPPTLACVVHVNFDSALRCHPIYCLIRECVSVSLQSCTSRLFCHYEF